jgi:hypothetical protein
MLDDILIVDDPVEPKFERYPFPAPKLGMMVCVGSYVILEGSVIEEQNCKLRNHDGKVIVRVTSYDGRTDTICGNVLVLLSSVSEEADGKDAFGNYLHRIQTGFSSGITELVGSRYNIVASKEDIIDLCFVFHIDDCKIGRAFGQGIKNCYIIRYQYKLNEFNNLQLEPMQYQSCFPSEYNRFKSIIGPCSHSLLWNSISKVQDTIWKVLNRSSEKQQNYCKVDINFDSLFWNYLLHRTEDVVKVTTVPSKYRRPNTSKGMKRKTVAVPQKTTILRFQTKKQLSVLRSILGNSSTIGVRKKSQS